MNAELLLRLGDIAAIVDAVIINAFVILYLTRNWRANRFGRALMYSKISLALVIDLSVAFIIWGEYPYRELIRLLLFTVVGISQGRLLFLLFGSKAADQETEKKSKETNV